MTDNFDAKARSRREQTKQGTPKIKDQKRERGPDLSQSRKPSPANCLKPSRTAMNHCELSGLSYSATTKPVISAAKYNKSDTIFEVGGGTNNHPESECDTPK